MFKNKISMPVVASSGGGGGYKIKPLKITKNGIYDSELEAYKPVYVSVPQVAQDGSLKALLDGTKSTYYLFYNYKGTSVDGLISYSDTASVTNASYMFNACSNLTSIPEIDTSNVTNMSYMFKECTSLTSIPKLNTSNVTNMNYMFHSCKKLTVIPELDVSRVLSFSGIFDFCSSLASIGMYGFIRSIDIIYTVLEHDALVAFLNQAGIAYDNHQIIKMGSTKLALLSDEEKAIATNKGWTLA